MPGYRLYFIDGKGSIQARQDLAAENDAEALTIAHILWQACSDCYAAFELWCLGRRVAFDGGAARLTSLEAMPQDLLQRVLTLHEDFQSGPWRAAGSNQLAESTDRLRQVLSRGPRAITPDEIVRYVRRATSTAMMSFQLVESRGLKLHGSFGFERWFDSYFDIVGDDTCCRGLAFQQAQQTIVTELAASAIFAGQESGEVLRAAGVASCISTPLVRESGGAVQGMFSIHRSAPWKPESRELDQLDALAREISAAMADPTSAEAQAIRRAV